MNKSLTTGIAKDFYSIDHNVVNIIEIVNKFNRTNSGKTLTKRNVQSLAKNEHICIKSFVILNVSSPTRGLYEFCIKALLTRQ